MSIVSGSKEQIRPGVTGDDIIAAKTAYAFAKANPGLSTSMLYAWTGMSYTDDLMCGAAELWRATSDSSYRADAVSRNTSIDYNAGLVGTAAFAVANP